MGPAADRPDAIASCLQLLLSAPGSSRCTPLPGSSVTACLTSARPPAQGCDTFSDAIIAQKAARKQALQPKPQEGDDGPISQPRKKKGGCFGCSSAPQVLEDFRLDMSYHGGEAQARAKLRFLADTDSFEEFPDIKVGAAGRRWSVHRNTASVEQVAWRPGGATWG